MNDEIIERLKRIEKNTVLASKRVLTLEDVSLISGFSMSYLYKLTSTHQIPHYKPNGKNIFFDRDEIEEWLKQNKVETDEAIDRRATTYVTTGRM